MNPHAWIDLAKLFNNQARYAEAIRACELALGVWPRNPEAWGVIAAIFIGMGAPSDAEDAMARLKDLDPNASELALLREEIRHRFGSPELAAKAAEQTPNTRGGWKVRMVRGRGALVCVRLEEEVKG